VHDTLPLFASDRGKFLAVGNERFAFVQTCAVKSEYAIICPTFERERFVFGFVVAPYADGLEPNRRRPVGVGHFDRNAPTVAIDPASEMELVGRHFGRSGAGRRIRLNRKHPAGREI
jgi:hypothetical protein